MEMSKRRVVYETYKFERISDLQTLTANILSLLFFLITAEKKNHLRNLVHDKSFFFD